MILSSEMERLANKLLYSALFVRDVGTPDYTGDVVGEAPRQRSNVAEPRLWNRSMTERA